MCLWSVGMAGNKRCYCKCWEDNECYSKNESILHEITKGFSVYNGSLGVIKNGILKRCFCNFPYYTWYCSSSTKVWHGSDWDINASYFILLVLYAYILPATYEHTWYEVTPFRDTRSVSNISDGAHKIEPSGTNANDHPSLHVNFHNFWCRESWETKRTLDFLLYNTRVLYLKP